MTTLRSALFLAGGVLITAVFGILLPIVGPFGIRLPTTVGAIYARIMLVWVRWTLGIAYEVEGWEHVPKEPVILMAKHQSAWETLSWRRDSPRNAGS